MQTNPYAIMNDVQAIPVTLTYPADVSAYGAIELKKLGRIIEYTFAFKIDNAVANQFYDITLNFPTNCLPITDKKFSVGNGFASGAVLSFVKANGIQRIYADRSGTAYIEGSVMYLSAG